MSMKLSYLRTYFDADDANCIIEFLGEVKELLWATYGAEIIERQQLYSQQKSDTDLIDCTEDDFDDQIPF